MPSSLFKASLLHLLTLYSWIHWVAASPAHASPIKAKVRIINCLFKSDNLASVKDFLSDINPNSEEVFSNAMIETGFEEIRRRAPWPAEAGEQETGEGKETVVAGPETVRFQGMRMGYFCIDKDSEGGESVLNRIVSLKEDTGKD